MAQIHSESQYSFRLSRNVGARILRGRTSNSQTLNDQSSNDTTLRKQQLKRLEGFGSSVSTFRLLSVSTAGHISQIPAMKSGGSQAFSSMPTLQRLKEFYTHTTIIDSHY